MPEPVYLEELLISRVFNYNPNYGDERVCKCGHIYGRHFDPFEAWPVVNCKYCKCYDFKERETDE